MEQRFNTIARKFRITPHEVDLELCKAARDKNVRLVENVSMNSTVFKQVAKEIYKVRDRLLSDSYIGSITDISGSVTIKKKPYIYYLFDDGALVYIGKTRNLLQRISAHQEDKQFDGVSYMEVNKHIMDMVETLNIYHYQPLLNIQGKSHLEFFKLVLDNCDFEQHLPTI